MGLVDDECAKRFNRKLKEVYSGAEPLVYMSGTSKKSFAVLYVERREAIEAFEMYKETIEAFRENIAVEILGV